MIPHFAHLDGKCDAVQQPDGLLVLAVLLIGVALPSDRDIIHARNRYNAGLVFRHVEFLIFLLEIKSHSSVLRVYSF